ncbi:TIGR00375 family protein [Ornithinibacillus gellani]|uniref:endonuclease Q family protein n=1 Tax=Ornithinibacillus gellani TaxID=2293253 RepID=UPI000F46A117|nr:endonuclease Q family protein [Ornithinibacillus gellani]TQS74479.1 TIGR00375 family protein [Ornithinibacillus gellani]
MLQSYFADMHIHIGRDMYDKPVKITGAKSLTLTNILKESSRRKGIHMIGVIDSHAPHVQQELQILIQENKAIELEEGGVQFENVTLILGSEIEIFDENCQGPIHVLCFFPKLENIQAFSAWLTERMKNISLSSQRYYGTARALQYKVKELEGIFIPAHVFTPFKSLYGKGVNRSLTEVFDPDLIDGIELGLSADTSMADQIRELHEYTFITNSDAHSLAKIAREYQEIMMEHPSFKEFYWALHQVEGRKIIRNFGMNPLLGKYHSTVCANCMNQVATQTALCPSCGSKQIVKGVADRIQELADAENNPSERPAYLYQVPLEYIPKLGPKTFNKLLNAFQTEMNIIHHVPYEQLLEVIPASMADAICQMREGQMDIIAGGGGRYGKLSTKK